MSLSHLLAAVWFILVGITWLGWVAIGTRFLGIWALITGIVWLVEAWQPINVWHRP
jgi:DMSO reductase anchor subunit